MRTAALLVLTLATATAPAQQAAGFAPGRLERVPALLRAEVENGNHAGASYLLLHRGEIAGEGAFGVADADTKAPLRADTIVRIYSMSKPITAVAALTLVESGVLRLDSPVREWLPELAAPLVWKGGTAEQPEVEPAASPITVRMLLNHTAGFSYDFYRSSPVHELYRRADLWGSASLDELLQRVAKLPLVAQPGTAWNYSIADDVLGILIERAANKPLADYVREHVTGPLRMVDTDYDVPEQNRGRLAALHRRVDGKLATMDPTFGVHAEAGRGFAAGGAGMFSTLADYARFARMLAGDGSLDGVRVLSRKTVELARRDSLRAGQKTSRAGDGWGLVCAVVSDPGAGSDLGSEGLLHWHGAATTTFFADPKEDVVAVMFAQHLPFDEHKLISRFRTAVFQALR
jgi:CubicO group peptidase (beta-lactamase class C family)